MPTNDRRRRHLLVFFAVLGVCVPLRGIATAEADLLHARLESSIPAADDTLDAPLDSVQLRFSETVAVDLTRLSITGPQGDRAVLAGRTSAGDRRVIVASVGRLHAGAHVLHWRTTSADGHVLEGTIPFVVGPAAATADLAVPPAAARAAAEGAAADAARDGDIAADSGSPGQLQQSGAAADTPPLLPLLRSVGTLLLLVLAGGLLFASRSEAAAAALLPALRVIALAAPLAAAAELVMWTSHVAGSLDFNASLQLATGRALLARAVFALIALLVLLAVRSQRWAAFSAFIAVLAGGALGHAGAITPVLSIPLRAVHMAAAAVWLGGLLALGLALRSAPAQRSLLKAVSSAALASFIVVAITGAGQALLLLGSFGALLQTTYGRLVLVKATGLLLLAAFGYLHRRMIAVVPEGGDAGLLRRSVAVEMLVFIALILVSGALAFAPLPE